ncbi:sorting nexin-16 isoform X1 [Tachysurus ichikawai]
MQYELKETFPGFRLSLPPKRWFKDNYDTDFLEDRQLGLQAFLQNLVAHKDIANCIAVREFLCLDEPPGPFDSLEESRAFCETLEEGSYRLQKELLEKQKEINSLRKMLEEKELYIHLLKKQINGESVTPESLYGLSAQGSESSVDAESSTAEADQDMPEESGEFSSSWNQAGFLGHFRMQKPRSYCIHTADPYCALGRIKVFRLWPQTCLALFPQAIKPVLRQSQSCLGATQITLKAL